MWTWTYNEITASIIGIAVITLIAILGGLFYYFFLRPDGKHTYMVGETHTGPNMVVRHRPRDSISAIPPQRRMARNPSPATIESDGDTEIFYGWPSEVAYFADVARWQGFINENTLAIPEWLPRYRKAAR